MTASVGNSEVGETQTVEQQDKNEHARSPTQQRRHGQGGGRHDEIGSSANPKTQAARMLSLRVELQTLHDRQPPRGLAVPGERGVVLEEAYYAWRAEVLEVEDKIMRLGHGLGPNGAPATAPKASSGIFERYPKPEKALAARLSTEKSKHHEGSAAPRHARRSQRPKKEQRKMPPSVEQLQEQRTRELGQVGL